MPNKLKNHDVKRREIFSKMKKTFTFEQRRARKYRSSSNWQKVVKIQKDAFPMCCDIFGIHVQEGGAVPMSEVHHINPLITHFQLRAYHRNLASICHKCHDKIEKMERKGIRTSHLFKRKRPEY